MLYCSVVLYIEGEWILNTRTRFPWREFLKSLAALAIPVALQNLLATTSSMIDTMMIAPLGETSVGAVGLCAQFSSLIFSSYWGFIGGGMLFFAQYWGAEDHKGIDRTFGITVVCTMTMAAIGMLCAVAFPEFIMGVYTDKAAIQEIGVKYLRIAGFSYPLQIFAAFMSAVLRSTERVRVPLYASIAAVATNIFLNWILIHGKFGIPAMGVRGAALATVIGQVVFVAVMFIVAGIQKFPYLFHFVGWFRWNKAFLKEFFKRCFPIICNEALIGVGMMVINMVLGRQSEAAIAAIAVFRTLEGLVIGFFAGFSNAASVLVGKCVGAGELRIAYERAKRLVFLCGIIIFALCLILYAVHNPLLTVMSLSGESLRIGSGMLLIYCIAAVIRMCNWTQNDTYRSAGDAATGTILEISFMYLMLIPCVCIAGLVLHLPVLAVFACCYIDEPIRFVLMQRHMYSGKWIRPVTEEGMNALPAFKAELAERKHKA